MDQALCAVIEMNELVWNRLKEDLEDLSVEEVNWRPLPQANSINLIVRHLRIEAEWKLATMTIHGPCSGVRVYFFAGSASTRRAACAIDAPAITPNNPTTTGNP